MFQGPRKWVLLSIHNRKQKLQWQEFFPHISNIKVYGKKHKLKKRIIRYQNNLILQNLTIEILMKIHLLNKCSKRKYNNNDIESERSIHTRVSSGNSTLEANHLWCKPQNPEKSNWRFTKKTGWGLMEFQRNLRRYSGWKLSAKKLYLFLLKRKTINHGSMKRFCDLYFIYFYCYLSAWSLMCIRSTLQRQNKNIRLENQKDFSHIDLRNFHIIKHWFIILAKSIYW